MVLPVPPVPTRPFRDLLARLARTVLLALPALRVPPESTALPDPLVRLVPIPPCRGRRVPPGLPGRRDHPVPTAR
jgi:hypothetical protein